MKEKESFKWSNIFGRPSGSKEWNSEALVVKEVEALMHYASKRGVAGDELLTLHKAMGTYNISLNKECDTEEEECHVASERNANEAIVLKLYTELASITQPVSGQTILDTRHSKGTLIGIACVSILFLILAVGGRAFSSYLASIPEPEEGIWLIAFQVQLHLFAHLEPYLWGAVGACVYLLKALYDIAQAQQFDHTKLQGWWLRVLLGAVLAAVTIDFFDLNIILNNEVDYDENIIAFIIGLGVKVVYGAFERMVESLASKMNLNAIKQIRTQSVDARSYLKNKLSDAEEKDDTERKKIISSLLEEINNEK